MKKQNIKLTESYLHNVLSRVLKESFEDDNLHDDLNLQSTSLNNENNFEEEDMGEDEESYINELAQEAISLADQLYYKLEEMCDECKNIQEPHFDEDEVEELRDSAEQVMNGLGEMFGDPEVY